MAAQRWGIGRVDVDGFRLYFTGGWGSGTGRVEHQVALLTRKVRYPHPPRHVHHPPSRGELENDPDQYRSVISRVDCLLGGDSVDPTGLCIKIGRRLHRHDHQAHPQR